MEDWQELARRNKEIGILNEIALVAGSKRDFRQIFVGFVEQMKRLFDFDSTGLFVLSEEGKPYRSWVTQQHGEEWETYLIDYPHDHCETSPSYHKSASYYVIAQGKPLIRRDWEEESSFMLDRNTQGTAMRSDILIPLHFDGEVCGVLSLASKNPHAYSEEDLPLLQQLVDQLSPAIHNTRLMTNLEKRNEEIRTLNEIATAVNADLGFTQIYQIFIGQVGRLLAFDEAALWVLDVSGETFKRWGAPLDRIGTDDGRIVVESGFLASASQPDFSNLPATSATYHVLVHGEPVIRSDWRKEQRFKCHPDLFAKGIRSDILMPLYFRNRVVGAFTINSKKSNLYSDADLPLLRKLADQLAPAIHNTQLLLNLEEKNKELEENRIELETKNAELERFTYTVSHDLKSPLVTIKGFLGLAEQDVESGDMERFKNDLQHISNAADQMERLLEELLQLSRIGRSGAPPTQVDLDGVAHEAVRLVGGQIAARGVAVSLGEGLPVVMGDRPRLLEVWQNLIDNAVKFMGDEPEPKIEIGQRQDGANVVYFVRDNGIGIEPCYNTQIFELFNRLQEDVEGTGIGLALVKRIVEVHGGKIWVESKGAGTGCTFCFTLDLKEGA